MANLFMITYGTRMHIYILTITITLHPHMPTLIHTYIFKYHELKMMLLLDFAVASVNRSGGKKPHGNHFNNNTDREYLSVSK